MEIAELVLKYISVLSYPAIIAISILLFRKELSNILSGNFRAKYKDLELTIEQSRKTIETIKDTQRDAIARIRESIDNIEPTQKLSPTISNMKVLLDTMEASLNDLERDVLSILRKMGGSCKEDALIEYYFENMDDPWHRVKYQDSLRYAIQELMQKSIVAKEKDLLRLHPIWQRKKN